MKSRSVWAWAAFGFAGSLIVGLAGPRAIDDSNTTWWYTPGIPGGRGVATALIYVGIAVVSAAWLGLSVHAHGHRTVWLLAIAAAWLLPLMLGPALFSRDVYSYIAQGTILNLGHNPYHTSPATLAGEGHAHVLAAVSPFWRHTTAPYGPLFLALMSGMVDLTGQHLVAGVLVIRLIELVGIVLLAVSVPHIARALGADRVRATWLAVMSPLLLFELVAAGHNDVLMAGLLAAGIAVALQGRPTLGVAICALAATFKLPALAGGAFIIVAWGRAEPDARSRAWFVGGALLTTAAVLAAVSLITGVGFTWLSTTLFSTPAKVRLAITPGTGIGWTVASVLHDVGWTGVNSRSVESVFGAVTLVITAAVGLALLYRVRVPKVAVYLGVLLLVAAAGGPAAWPWYFTWGLVLLAGCPGWQHSRALALGAVVTAFLVKPNGILALPLHTAPAVMAVYAAVAVVIWRSRRSGRGTGDRGAAGHGPRVGDPTPSALART